MPEIHEDAAHGGLPSAFCPASAASPTSTIQYFWIRTWFPFSKYTVQYWAVAACIPYCALFRSPWIRVGPRKLTLVTVNVTDLSAITHFNSPRRNVSSVARILCFPMKNKSNYIDVSSTHFSIKADREQRR
jgi:hypothetical protein